MANEKVLQALLGLKFMEIEKAMVYGVNLHIPWKHLATESVTVDIDRVALITSEPDEELELQELPAVFQSKSKKKKSGDKKPSSAKR